MSNLLQFPSTNRLKVERLFAEIKKGKVIPGDENYVSLIEILLGRPHWAPTDRHIRELIDIKGRTQKNEG